MILYEGVKMYGSTLNYLTKMGYKHGDCKYIPLFEDYLLMKKEGDKVVYIVAALSDKYGVSERKIYDIIGRFSSSCNICAVDSGDIATIKGRPDTIFVPFK